MVQLYRYCGTLFASFWPKRILLNKPAFLFEITLVATALSFMPTIGWRITLNLCNK